MDLGRGHGRAVAVLAMNQRRPVDVNIWAAALAQRTVRGTTCRASEVYSLAVALLERFNQSQVAELVDIVVLVRMRGESFHDAGLRIAQMVDEHDAVDAKDTSSRHTQ